MTFSKKIVTIVTMNDLTLKKDIVREHCGFEENIPDSEIFLEDTYDDFLIGVAQQFSTYTPAYDYDAILEKIKIKNGFSENKAIDFINEKLLTEAVKVPPVSFIKKIDIGDLKYYDDNIIIFTDLESAFIGLKIERGMEIVAAFDGDLCIDVLTSSMDGDEEAAYEWFEYNTLGSYVGNYTPAIVYYL